MREVLSTWTPGEVLAQADELAYRNALMAAEMDAARGDA